MIWLEYHTKTLIQFSKCKSSEMWGKVSFVALEFLETIVMQERTEKPKTEPRAFYFFLHWIRHCGVLDFAALHFSFENWFYSTNTHTKYTPLRNSAVRAHCTCLRRTWKWPTIRVLRILHSDFLRTCENCNEIEFRKVKKRHQKWINNSNKKKTDSCPNKWIPESIATEHFYLVIFDHSFHFSLVFVSILYAHFNPSPHTPQSASNIFLFVFITSHIPWCAAVVSLFCIADQQEIVKKTTPFSCLQWKSCIKHWKLNHNAHWDHD